MLRRSSFHVRFFFFNLILFITAALSATVASRLQCQPFLKVVSLHFTHRSDRKFHCECGWPAFSLAAGARVVDDEVDESGSNVRRIEDRSHGMQRVEARCKQVRVNTRFYFALSSSPIIVFAWYVYVRQLCALRSATHISGTCSTTGPSRSASASASTACPSASTATRATRSDPTRRRKMSVSLAAFNRTARALVTNSDTQGNLSNGCDAPFNFIRYYSIYLLTLASHHRAILAHISLL